MLANTCITCSFQAEDVVVLDMLRRLLPNMAVLFLDTGYHFPETLALRDELTARWNLRLVNLVPQRTETSPGADVGACCAARKVGPLMRGLEDYDVWFTGLRREQAPTRARLETVERHTLPGGRQLWKISLLSHWTWKQVWDYTIEHQLPYLPLYDRGYRSIGCAPCTSPVAPDADARSGRWDGAKLECGIHTFTEQHE